MSIVKIWMVTCAVHLQDCNNNIGEVCAVWQAPSWLSAWYIKSVVILIYGCLPVVNSNYQLTTRFTAQFSIMKGPSTAGKKLQCKRASLYCHCYYSHLLITWILGHIKLFFLLFCPVEIVLLKVGHTPLSRVVILNSKTYISCSLNSYFVLEFLNECLFLYCIIGLFAITIANTVIVLFLPVVANKTWNHWNNAIIPERTGIQERQLAREARRAERDRYIWFAMYLLKIGL